jgi:hypothetical protein
MHIKFVTFISEDFVLIKIVKIEILSKLYIYYLKNDLLNKSKSILSKFPNLNGFIKLSLIFNKFYSNKMFLW